MFKTALKFRFEAKNMKLTYRGIAHRNQSSQLEITPTEIGGKYRGQNWNYNYPRHIPNLESRQDLKYRGLSYQGNSSLQTQQSPVCQATETPRICSVPIKKPHSLLEDETVKIHWDNIRRNLERRLQIAKASGNEALVNLLEEESRQLALN